MEYEINLENLVKMKRVFEVRQPPRRHHQPRSLRTRRSPPSQHQPACPSTCLPCFNTRLQEADEDGSGELDPGEFYDKLGPCLGQALTEAQVALLFMRIDADCGGTIDWEVGGAAC
jgi:hypothetical protein